MENEENKEQVLPQKPNNAEEQAHKETLPHHVEDVKNALLEKAAQSEEEKSLHEEPKDNNAADANAEAVTPAEEGKQEEQTHEQEAEPIECVCPSCKTRIFSSRKTVKCPICNTEFSSVDVGKIQNFAYGGANANAGTVPPGNQEGTLPLPRHIGHIGHMGQQIKDTKQEKRDRTVLLQCIQDIILIIIVIIILLFL